MSANDFRWVGLLVLLVGCGSSGTSLPGGDAGAGTGGAVTTGGSPGTGGATGGNMGTGGSGGTGGATGGTGGTGGSGGKDAGASCDCGSFAAYRMCCGGKCTNPQNDPGNCGGCGTRCPTDKPFCEGGTCKQAPCASPCPAGNCCGNMCCGTGQICCSIEGPLGGVVACHTPTAEQPTCPAGCAPLCISDRNLKQSIQPVDPQEVLAKLRRLPISRWRYRSEPEGVQHLGPMAQDFKQAFGLGDSDRTYHAVDAHGVALAAIQALQRQAEEQRRRIDRLEREKQALERRLKRLEARD